MDSQEFISRFHEAQRAAGGRPVEVEFQTVITSRGRLPKGHVSIDYHAAKGSYSAELTKPRIVITYQS